MNKIEKAKTQQGKRALAKKEPKAIENTKNAMFIKGGQTSQTVTQALRELLQLKKPHGVMYKRKNVLRPFEDETPLEFFSDRGDNSLFVFGSHSKKRPHNLVLGRLYDGHVLDMFELGIDKFAPMDHFKTVKCAQGSKPCLLFSGMEFDSDPTYGRLKNTLIDFFRGPVIKNIRLAGLEHVISFTSMPGKVLMKTYRIRLKKSGEKTPRVEVEEMGPSLDLAVRRSRQAAPDLYRRSCRVPRVIKPKKKKNVSFDAFGTKMGRVHVGKQNLDRIQTRKVRALKRGAGKAEGQAGKKAKTGDDEAQEES